MFGPVEITRGCPFACSFCQTSHIFGALPRHRSIDAVVAQAAALGSANRKVLRLLSPNAFSYGSPDGRQINPGAIAGLLAAPRETVSPGGRIIFGHFPSEVRPEHVTRETLGLLREFAHNDEIVIGAQSGSQHMLDACHRSHTVEHVMTLQYRWPVNSATKSSSISFLACQGSARAMCARQSRSFWSWDALEPEFIRMHSHPSRRLLLHKNIPAGFRLT